MSQCLYHKGNLTNANNISLNNEHFKNTNNSNINNQSPSAIITNGNLSHLDWNNLKMQLMKKDKSIMSYSKSWAEANKKSETWTQALQSQENAINQLKSEINSLHQDLEKKDLSINDLEKQIIHYKTIIEQEQDKTTKSSKANTDKYNEIIVYTKDLEKKYTSLESHYTQQEDYILQLKHELAGKTEKISQFEIWLSKENEQKSNYIALINKISEYEEYINSWNNEINRHKLTISSMQSEYNGWTEHLNNITLDFSNKESTMNSKWYSLSNEISTLHNEINNKNEENAKWKLKANTALGDNEHIIEHITNKSKELITFIDYFSSSAYASDTKSQESQWKNIDDIRYEIIGDIFKNLKKKIFNYAQLQQESYTKMVREYNEISKSYDTIYTEHHELIKMFNALKQLNQEDKNNLLKQQKELEDSSEIYVQLKNSFTSLYNDYTKWNEKNEIFIRDNNASVNKLITKIESLNWNEINKIRNESHYENNKMNKISNYITILIEEINSTTALRSSEEESHKKSALEKEKVIDELKMSVSTLQNTMDDYRNSNNEKVKKLKELLDESKKMIVDYQSEIQELKNKNETINYRYQMLLSSNVSEAVINEKE